MTDDLSQLRAEIEAALATATDLRAWDLGMEPPDQRR
jgi:hypothetical protein